MLRIEEIEEISNYLKIPLAYKILNKKIWVEIL